MKVLQTKILISNGNEELNFELEQAYKEVYAAIATVVWPGLSDKFVINPVKAGNGVKPIKDNCMLHLAANDWKLEYRMSIGSRLKPGPIDAVKVFSDGRCFAVEWETGNISSSHRALNKLALGIQIGVLAGGILILPSRRLYKFLTDRIGNYCEIEPYFPMWESLGDLIENGYLAVIEIEHDETSTEVAFIPKGTDGRSQV
jgi:hypothetical protein